MKVAIVIERVEPWRGGAETSTTELARDLLTHGHEVHVVTASRSPSPPDMTFHTLSPATVIRPLRTAGFIRQASAFFEHQSFDVIHSVVPLPCADVYQPRGGLLRETIERNVALRKTSSGRLLKRALAQMNVKQNALLELERRVFRADGPGILAVSQYVARQCERHYGVTSPRVRVILNGVTPPTETPARRKEDRSAIRKQYGLGESTLLLLFVAHNFRLKGLGPLLEALVRVREAGAVDLKLLAVGRDNPVRFTRSVEKLGLSDVVTFTGPTQRVGAFYHAADVCVHPTYYDPCSRVVLEALARGVPCITTRYNGAAEFMTDGREGFILDRPDDVETMANRIVALRSAELRRDMAARAAELKDRISMSRHVRELDEYFRKLVSRRRRSRTA